MTRMLMLWSVMAGMGNAHPMGNFSVGHYSRFELGARETRLTYVLDFAEIPAFELLQHWGITGEDVSAVRGHVRAQAPRWVANLVMRHNGSRVTPQISDTTIRMADGGGGMPLLRVTIEMAITGGPGHLEFEDHNYEERTGWKEIVIRGGQGVAVTYASHGGTDRSSALSKYPQDVSAPPQDGKASMTWTAPARSTAGKGRG